MEISHLLAAIGTLSGVILYLYRRIERHHAIAIQVLKDANDDLKDRLKDALKHTEG